MEFAAVASIITASELDSVVRSFVYFRYLIGSRGFGLDVIVALITASINLLDVIAAIAITSKFAISLCFAII